MGICASCLGLNRRSSHSDENDPLLDNPHPQYGGLGAGDVPQPDEEELRREREELDHITTEATDNMIDVLHPNNTDLGRRFAHSDSSQWQHPAEQSEHDGEYDDEESAWLQSVQASIGEDVGVVKGLESGTLVLDASQLRVESAGLAPTKSLKSKPPVAALG